MRDSSGIWMAGEQRPEKICWEQVFHYVDGEVMSGGICGQKADPHCYRHSRKEYNAET